MWKTADMRSPASSDLPGWPRLLSPPARRSSVPPHRPRAREARDGRPCPQSQPPAFVPQRGRCQRDSHLQGRCSDSGRATQTAWENPGITKTQGEKGLGEMQGIRISFIYLYFFSIPKPWEEAVLQKLSMSLHCWSSAPTRKRPTKDKIWADKHFRQHFLV